MAKRNGSQERSRSKKKAMRAKRRKRKLILFCMELLILAGVLGWLWVNAKMDKITTDETFQAKDVENEE